MSESLDALADLIFYVARCAVAPKVKHGLYKVLVEELEASDQAQTRRVQAMVQSTHVLMELHQP